MTTLLDRMHALAKATETVTQAQLAINEPGTKRDDVLAILNMAALARRAATAPDALPPIPPQALADHDVAVSLLGEMFARRVWGSAP
jgi:hypothetical protein